MPIREVELDNPIVVTYTTEQFLECKLYADATGSLHIAATYRTPDEDGIPQFEIREVSQENMNAILADPAMATLLDTIISSTRTQTS
jgi:hypothetical protein